MSASRLEDFRRAWDEKGTLMADEHWEERVYYIREADKKKKRAREDAQTQLDNLRNGDDPLTSFDDEARKIKENLGATLKSIEEASGEILRGIERIQRKEMAGHEQAYHEALAARPFMNDILPSYSPTTIVANTDYKTVPNSRSTALASRKSATISSVPHSRDRMLPTPDDISTITEHGESTVFANRFSCTVQREYADGKEQLILRYKTENREALQEIAELRDNQSLSINSSVNPLSTPENEPGVSRTITFNEVYQNGQAKHKDTIVEYPPFSRRWYIIKCEEHNMRFGLRPLQGAAKHLNGQLHGGLDKSWALAAELLGYRVIDCTRELAVLNNEVVQNAFANGYQPISISNPEKKTRRKQNPEISQKTSYGIGATAIPQKRSGTPKTKGALSSIEKRRIVNWKSPTKIITNPKTFHIYDCFWKDHQCLYPVMILAWDDQRPGGLEHDLASTGLLDNPPNCYIYKDTDDGKNKAIAGWAPGFEDGGLKVKQRKFPAMFFDFDKKVSWVSANLLKKFPLFEPDPPKKKSDPFNVARRWIVKNEGFSSWEEFEKARKGEVEEGQQNLVSTPTVSSLSDTSDTEIDSVTESSVNSCASHATENVLEEMKDKAGETTGDSDYTASNVDSSSDNEDGEWEGVETDIRPWAWYRPREKLHTDPKTTELSSSKPKNNPVNNEAGFFVQEGMETARRLSAHACTQQEGYLAKQSLDAEISPLEISPKKTVQQPAQDGDNQSSEGTPMTNLNAANAVDRATPPPEEPLSQHISKVDDDTRVEGDLQDTLCTPTSLLNQSSLSSGELAETSKGMKRVRSEEAVKTDNNMSGEQSVKKLKQDVETSDNQASTPINSEPQPSASTPIAPLFKPKEPNGPAVFELSSYSKGLISWTRESEETSVRLYFGEDDRVVGTVDAPVNIMIDPTTLRGITREEIPETKGNVVTTLFSKDPDDEPVKLVFDRPRGSKVDIGKVQSRKFLRWMRSIVPTLRLLNG